MRINSCQQGSSSITGPLDVARVSDGREVPAGDALVVIPTYNEIENIQSIARAVLAVSSRTELLFVDDQSPDGTGVKAEELAAANPRIHALHRRGPRGLGAAYMAGFRWALRRPYRFVVQMDADFSHSPAAIPKLLKGADHFDVVIGSRYCGGGRTVGWPLGRKWLSFIANTYARTLLTSRIRDFTSGFRCWRREVLEQIDFASLCCDGYGFQVEMAHLAELGRFSVREVPITFRERRGGVSKMRPEVAKDAARGIARLAWRRLADKKHPALILKGRRADEAPSPGLAGNAPQSVLVMCLGGIGDTVLSFAMLRRLREHLPGAHLTALAMWPQAAELIKDLGIFEEVRCQNFQTDRCWRSIAELVRLNHRRFDLSILAYPTNRWEYSLAAWLVHAKKRVGHAYKDSSDFLGRWLLTDRVQQGNRTHNVDENLNLLTQVTGGVGLPDGEPDIRLGPLMSEYHDYAHKFLASIPGPYLGIHAGSSTAKNMAAKRWSKEKFAELCRIARQQLGLTPLLFGTGREIALNEWIASRCSAARVVESPSIRHEAAVMQRCSVFVSNDSALAHIASALDVPTVTIFGPTDADQVGPYGGTGIAVTAGLPCAPCYRPCRRSMRCSSGTPRRCLSILAPNIVVEHVRDMLYGAQYTDRAEPCRGQRKGGQKVGSGRST